MVNKFNIRVYGVWIEDAKVLLANEEIDNFRMTKFPGGGLELGEGLKDGLRREYLEETGLAIDIERHLYTTDFFVPSAFKKNEQIVSVYYAVKGEHRNFPLTNIVSDRHSIRFEWKLLKELTPSDMTFPIDRHLVENGLLR